MRTTLEIIVAVKDCEPVSEHELKLALVAVSSIEYFIRHDLQSLIDAIAQDKPLTFLKMKADFAKGTIERMFTAEKTPPDKWLGPAGIPGTPENLERMELGRRIFKKATGLDL